MLEPRRRHILYHRWSASEPGQCHRGSEFFDIVNPIICDIGQTDRCPTLSAAIAVGTDTEGHPPGAAPRMLIRWEKTMSVNHYLPHYGRAGADFIHRTAEAA
ncbi:MAG: hypothetical protein DI546_01350 [Rhizobium sp.]|nr:MAG: hypothetical protein DI546_01350 [Rhizobium sp.]